MLKNRGKPASIAAGRRSANAKQELAQSTTAQSGSGQVQAERPADRTALCSGDSFEAKQAKAEKKSRILAFLWIVPIIALFAVYGIIKSRWTLHETDSYALFVEKVISRRDAASFESILEKRLAAHGGALSADGKKPVLFLIGYNQYNINADDSLLSGYFNLHGRNHDFAYARTAAKHPFPYEFVFRVNMLRDENIIFIKGDDSSLYQDYVEYWLLSRQIDNSMSPELRRDIDMGHANDFPVVRQIALEYYLWEKTGGGSPGGKDASYRTYLDAKYGKDSRFWNDIDIYYGYSGDEISDTMNADYAFADYISKLSAADRALYYSRLLNGGFASWKEAAAWKK